MRRRSGRRAGSPPMCACVRVCVCVCECELMSAWGVSRRDARLFPGVCAGPGSWSLERRVVHAGPVRVLQDALFPGPARVPSPLPMPRGPRPSPGPPAGPLLHRTRSHPQASPPSPSPRGVSTRAPSCRVAGSCAGATTATASWGPGARSSRRAPCRCQVRRAIIYFNAIRI